MNKEKSVKKYSIIVVFILLISICCFSVLAFSWYGGYVKNFLCKSVTTDSEIYTSLKCNINENVSNADTDNSDIEGNESIKIEQNLESNDLTIVDVVEDNSPAVVGIGINVENVVGDNLIGTGFLISNEGLLVTNRHVVESEANDYYVVFKGLENSIEIVNKDIFRDPVNDIALIKIDPQKLPKGIMPIKLGDSDKVKLGETAVAIGNPLGEFSGTVTKGIISGLNREVRISQGFFATGSQIYQGVIQTDAAINPGNSGGPLLNLRGEVIGVNFATVDGASNLSFALPINWIKKRIDEVERFGKFKVPFLGIEFRTKVMFIENQTVVGAEIISIVGDSPAAKSGLKPGDIIVSFDEKDLNNNNLVSLIQQTEIGEEVEIVYFRNREQAVLSVEIGEK